MSKAKRVQIEKAHKQVTQASAGKKNTKSKGTGNWKKKLVIILVSCLVFLVIAAGAIFWMHYRDDGLIFNNVFAMDMNLQGMTQQEAEAALREKADKAYAQPLTIMLQDEKLVLTPEECKVKLDTAALAQAAYEYGRDGNMFQRVKARAAAAATTYELPIEDYLTLDRDYVRSSLEALGAAFSSSLTQTSVTVEGKRPDLAKFALPDTNRPEDQPSEEEEEEPEEGEVIVIPMDKPYYPKGGQVMTIHMGTSGRTLDTAALYQKVLEQFYAADFTTVTANYEQKEPDKLDLSKIFADNCTAPVDAVFDEKTYVASKEALGYGFVLEDIQKKIDSAKEGEVIEVPFQLLVPKAIKANLEADYFKDSLVSISTDHTWNEKRTTNLRLACEAIDGYILAPGATFSFNEVVGERTSEKGYQDAAVYSGNNTVDEVGGGVCQVASTLYYGALLADFEIVERAVHTFAVSYVPTGMDATVYWGSLDFKFRNNTDYPVKIYMSVHDGAVHLEYVGTDTKDYYVEMEWVEDSRTPYEVVDVEYTDEIAREYPDKGIGDTIVTGYTGYAGNSYKCKYSKETDELISREWEDDSSYARRDEKVLVAPKSWEPAPTEPPQTEPAPTEPAPTEPPQTEPAPTEPPVTEPAPPESVPPESLAPGAAA